VRPARDLLLRPVPDRQDNPDHCGACGNASARETSATRLRRPPGRRRQCGGLRPPCGGGETCVAGSAPRRGCRRGRHRARRRQGRTAARCPARLLTDDEGTTICSYTFTTFSACGECETSADCAVFDPAAVCVWRADRRGPCCGLDNPTVCRLPCPTPSLAGRQGDNKRSEHGTPRRNSPIGRTRTDATRLNNGAGVGGPR
jgi:hypothetical protein